MTGEFSDWPKLVRMVPVSIIVFCLGGIVAVIWAHYNGASGETIADITTLFIQAGVLMGLAFFSLHLQGSRRF